MARPRLSVEGLADVERFLKPREPGAPETVRVRMRVDLTGELGEELDRHARDRGMTREAVVREGLGYISKALRGRRNAPFVGRP